VKGLLVDYLSGMGTVANFRTIDNATNKPHLVIWTK